MRYTKEFLEPLVKNNISVTDILKELGMRANGGSHSHISRVIKKYSLDTSHFIYGSVVERFKRKAPTREALETAVINNVSVAGVVRELGFDNCSTGRWHRELCRLIKYYRLDITHFTGKIWNKGSKMPVGKGNKKEPRTFLIVKDESAPRTHGKKLKRALLEIGRPDSCEYCGQGPVWNDKPLVLEVDHKNGKFWDNREENLAISCPNCHSQLPTFGIRNLTNLNPPVLEQQTSSF